LAIIRNVVKTNYYRDSLQLLHLSEEAKKIEGVKDAAVVMATSTNKEILSKLKLLTGEGLSASSSDLVIAIAADSEPAIDHGIHRIEALLTHPPTASKGRFHTIEAALQSMPDANLAIVSIPGEHARRIVSSLLEKGLNVHLFSDHVSQEDEFELKKLAKSKGLLVMGPGAGTSIIAGTAIAFANVVRKGNVGIVAAAGTGLQEVSVLLNEGGLGISQALGTGGGDVKDQIGGITTLQAIEALEKDTSTSIIVIVSKPPDAMVKKKIFDYASQSTSKPIVICFLGAEWPAKTIVSGTRISLTRTLHAAVLETLKRASPTASFDSISMSPNEMFAIVNEVRKELKGRQRYVRGLYTGGTLAYEALVILNRLVGNVYSNAPLNSSFKLPDSSKSFNDSILDLGEEEFTLGRAHPMIDPTVRQLRLVEEAKDPEVAVIIMDIMLGYGSHPDPAGAMCDSISKAKMIAKNDGRVLAILAHVCGTDQDPQRRTEQIEKLRNVGVRTFPTNALMVTAGALISRRDITLIKLNEFYKQFMVTSHRE
jgi:succinyl-CoA synthetase alpha subunit